MAKQDLISKVLEEIQKVSNQTAAAATAVKNEAKKQTSGGTGTTTKKTSEKSAVPKKANEKPETQKEPDKKPTVEASKPQVQLPTLTQRQGGFGSPGQMIGAVTKAPPAATPTASRDAKRRENFAKNHPEMTGGMEGARTRAANTAVVMAQAQVNATQAKVDEARKRLDEEKAKRGYTQASTYLTGGVVAPVAPYATGPQAAHLKNLEQDWQQDRKMVGLSDDLRQAKGKLYDANKALIHAQNQKSELDRERELLAEVSTPQWNQRIWDRYAKSDQYGRVSDMEVRSQKIKAAKGMVQLEMKEFQREMDEASEIMEREWGEAGGFLNPDHPSQKYRDAQKRYSVAKESYDRLAVDLNDLSRMDYSARNESSFERMAADPSAAEQYVSATKVLEDQQKLYEVIGYHQKGGGGSPEEYERISQMEAELLQDYGLSEAAINAYVGGYAPYDGETSVGQVMERMNTLLSDHQKALEETDGEKTGYDFQDQYGYEQRLQRQEEAAKRARENAQYAREHPVLSSVGTVLVYPFQAADIVNFDPGKGNPGDVGYIPPDTSGMALTSAIQTIRGTIASDLERNTDWELFGRNIPAFLYNTGMSMADSALAVSTLGTGSVYLMGMNAAVNTAKDVVDNGGTTDQALKLGLTAGAAEILFEKVSVENLLKPRTAEGWREVLTRYVLKQGGIELSEEALTETANIFAEMAVLGNSSDYAKAVNRYQGEGKTESQAKRQAFLDMLSRIGWAGAGGFVSGVGMSGGKAAVDYAGSNGWAGRDIASWRSAETVQGSGVDVDTHAVQTGKRGAFVAQDVSPMLKSTLETQKAAFTGEMGSAATHVGRATTIQYPYDGEVPTYIKPESQSSIGIDQNTLTQAQERVAQAHRQERATGRSFKSFLRTVYETIFAEDGGQRGVVIEGTRMAGRPYVAMLNKSAVGKVIADVNLSAEKLAIFDVLDDVIASGEYVGSGKYISHGKKTKDTVRFDYFETPVTIGDKPYIVTFDVEVFQNVNNYRTHKVISEIDLTPVGPNSAVTNQPKGTAPADTGSDLPQEAMEQSLSLKTSIPQSAMDVNLKGRSLGDRVADATKRTLEEMARTEKKARFQRESKPLRDRLAQVQAESKAAMAQIEDRYGRAVAERGTEQTTQAEGGESAETGKTKDKTSGQGGDRPKKQLQGGGKSDIMRTGARDPQSMEADIHAAKYYGLVRAMKTDVARIAKATGFDEADVRKIKEFLFVERHDLGGEEDECFFPHYMIAESWQRLVAGTPEPHDITLLNHELLERSLMERGLTQAEAHREASKQYNYDKESDDFYGNTKKH